MTVGVNPGEAVLYVEYDIDGVFDWLCEGEFVFDELLDANGVFDTLCELDEDPQGDKEELGLKVTVEDAEGQDETIPERVNPGDAEINGVWEELELGDTDIPDEALGVNPLDGVNWLVVDWETIGVIELDKDTKEDELDDANGDALSDAFGAGVWDAIGVWEIVANEETEVEGITETEADSVVEDEIDPLWVSIDETERDGTKVGVLREDTEGSTEGDISELLETEELELTDA
jgi:hypothetical protein